MTRDTIGLGLESSCDETAASVILNGSKILSNVVFSQTDLHREYYGVVPEIASRAHLEFINLIVKKALEDAGTPFDRLDYVSATNRPGLVGSLLISLQSAKAISFTLGIPLIAINHLEAHLYAPFLEGYDLKYPYIGLLISGGNTALYKMESLGKMELIGKTMDDAVGEAFDKIAKYLDIGYPGGPVIEKMAKKAVKKNIILPKLLADSTEFRFSYSGIKTAVVNYIKKNPDCEIPELLHAFQERSLEVLTRMLLSAVNKYGINRVVVAGGVAANNRLREMLLNEKNETTEIIFPSMQLCTDNAAMVGGLGYQYFIKKMFDPLTVDVFART